MAAFTTISEQASQANDKPRQADLDRCVHCGLCLNACPTYRVLGVEMDSPRGRIYQMIQVAGGAPITPSYVEHIELCLACRGCETACPSGVPYGRLVEAARAGIEEAAERSRWSRFTRALVYRHLLQSPALMAVFGTLLYLYGASGIQRLVRGLGFLKLLGKLGEVEQLAPPAELPFFFGQIGKTFPARGERRYRVAFMAGCIANVSFARLNEATVRVLQRSGCEVVVPEDQRCCGALHVHAGLRQEARRLARRNIDAVLKNDFDAIITNAAGCGCAMKEYGELLEGDSLYAERAHEFSRRMRDVTEFLASIPWNRDMGALPITVTCQESCHLAHGQKVRSAPRKLLESVPRLTIRDMPQSDLCCGSAGVYNVVHNEMALQLLETKMRNVNATGAEVIVATNPGCILQLRAGARLYGKGQRVAHVVELLDEAYRAAD